MKNKNYSHTTSSQLNREQFFKVNSGSDDTTITLDEKGLHCVSFSKATRNFAAEDSTLQGNGYPLKHSLMSIVTLYNPKTRQSLGFMMTKVHYTNDEDHELTHWEYTPINATNAKIANVKSFIVFND